MARMAFPDLLAAIHHQSLFGVQAGRYYVALSLEEAESLRAALHIAGDVRPVLGDGHSTAVALRSVKASGALLDASAGFAVNGDFRYQGATALQCLRYLDSVTEFKEMELALLRRALAESPLSARRQFFEDVIACRRRPALPLLEQPVARVFTSGDELKTLRQRALASRIKNSVWEKASPSSWSTADSANHSPDSPALFFLHLPMHSGPPLPLPLSLSYPRPKPCPRPFHCSPLPAQRSTRRGPVVFLALHSRPLSPPALPPPISVPRPRG